MLSDSGRVHFWDIIGFSPSANLDRAGHESWVAKDGELALCEEERQFRFLSGKLRLVQETL
jgi:hypothetical protein